MKLVKNDGSSISLSRKGFFAKLKGIGIKVKDFIVSKAKDLWGRIKPKLQAFHNKLTTIVVSFFESLADKTLQKAEKMLDKMAVRLGVDPEDDSLDGDTVDIDG